MMAWILMVPPFLDQSSCFNLFQLPQIDVSKSQTHLTPASPPASRAELVSRRPQKASSLISKNRESYFLPATHLRMVLPSLQIVFILYNYWNGADFGYGLVKKMSCFILLLAIWIEKNIISHNQWDLLHCPVYSWTWDRNGQNSSNLKYQVSTKILSTNPSGCLPILVHHLFRACPRYWTTADLEEWLPWRRAEPQQGIQVAFQHAGGTFTLVVWCTLM
jgi:hypothetical protein